MSLAQMPMKSYVIWLAESKPHPTSLTRRHVHIRKHVAVQRGNVASVLVCSGLDLDVVYTCICLELNFRPRY